MKNLSQLTAGLLILLATSPALAKPACTDEMLKGVRALGGSDVVRLRVDDPVNSNKMVSETEAKIEKLGKSYDDAMAEIAAKEGEVEPGTVMKIVRYPFKWNQRRKAIDNASEHDDEISFNQSLYRDLSSSGADYFKEKEEEIGEKGIDSVLISNNNLNPLGLRYTHGYIRKNRLVGYKVEGKEWTTIVKFREGSCDTASIVMAPAEGGSAMKLSPQLCESAPQLSKLAAAAQAEPKLVSPGEKCLAKGGKYNDGCFCADGTSLKSRANGTCFDREQHSATDNFERFVKAKNADVELKDAAHAAAHCTSLKGILDSEMPKAVRDAVNRPGGISI